MLSRKTEKRWGFNIIKILSLALYLVSCGSDNGGSNSGDVFPILATDPYVANAVFFYDQNNNGIYDPGELISTPSDTSGYATFSSIIPVGGKIVQYQGGIMEGFNYNGKLKAISNGFGGIILSPLTTLSANGFTDQQIVNLLKEANILITPEEINQNPMENPNLLRAALTVSQGLLSTVQGFDFSPSDATISSTSTTFNSSYSQELFNKAAKVYSQVITENEFNTNLASLSKTASSFLNFISNFGTEDFVTPGGTPTVAIQNAIDAIDHVLIDSESSYQPAVLTKTGNNYLAKVVKNQWFEDESYDIIGIDYLNITTPIVNKTIGNYPLSPRRARINLAPATVVGSKMNTPANLNRQNAWEVDTDNNLIFFQGKLSQFDGSKPENAQTVNGFPISTYDEFTSTILRGAGNMDTNIPLNQRNLRLVGDGEVLLNYYGIDWRSDASTDERFWTVNKSRTNNCIITGIPTTLCNPNSSPGPSNYYYNTQKANSLIKSIQALTDSSDPGTKPKFTIKFSVKNTSLKNPQSVAPIDYIVTVPLTIDYLGNVVDASVLSTLTYSLAGLRIDDGGIPRNPLNDSEDISFKVDYTTFPTDYKVYGINYVSVTTKNGIIIETKTCPTINTSSFYKAGMLILEFPLGCKSASFPMQYVLVDLVSRKGLAASYVEDWVEGSVIKFKYRDFNYLNIKEVLP